MAIPQHLAKKIAEAKVTGQGTPFRDGNYICVIKRIVCEEKYKGNYYIPEFDVVEAEQTDQKISPNKPGSDVSCAWSLDAPGKAGDASRSNIKQFICGAFNVESDTEEFDKCMNEYAGKRNSEDSDRARGVLVGASTYRKKILSGANAGTEGCFVKFTYVGGEENDPDQIARRRAELDKLGR